MIFPLDLGLNVSIVYATTTTQDRERSHELKRLLKIGRRLFTFSRRQVNMSGGERLHEVQAICLETIQEEEPGIVLYD